MLARHVRVSSTSYFDADSLIRMYFELLAGTVFMHMRFGKFAHSHLAAGSTYLGHGRCFA